MRAWFVGKSERAFITSASSRKQAKPNYSVRTFCETLKVCTSGYCDWRNRIARLMRSMHLQGVSRRRAWCVTTERNQRQRPAPDLLKRRFVVKDISEL